MCFSDNEQMKIQQCTDRANSSQRTIELQMKQSDDGTPIRKEDMRRVSARLPETETAASAQTMAAAGRMAMQKRPVEGTPETPETPRTYQSSVKIAMRPPTAAQNLKKPSLLPKPKVKNAAMLLPGRPSGIPRMERRLSSGTAAGTPATDNIDGPGSASSSATCAQPSPNSRIPVRTMATAAGTTTTTVSIEVADASDGAHSLTGTSGALIK